MTNRVVVRFADGRVIKGSTADFSPERRVFHLLPADAEARKTVEIAVNDLKALFFVKEFAGNPTRVDSHDVSHVTPAMGRKVRVHFADGEVLTGTTQSYRPQRQGFFFVPADPASNNDRCYIVNAAVAQVKLL